MTIAEELAEIGKIIHALSCVGTVRDSRPAATCGGALCASHRRRTARILKLAEVDTLEDTIHRVRQPITGETDPTALATIWLADRSNK